jgi:hypothetical protein
MAIQIRRGLRIREILVKFSSISRTRQIDGADDDGEKACGATTGTVLAALSVKIDDTLAANFKPFHRRMFSAEKTAIFGFAGNISETNGARDMGLWDSSCEIENFRRGFPGVAVFLFSRNPKSRFFVKSVIALKVAGRGVFVFSHLRQCGRNKTTGTRRFGEKSMGVEP